MLHLVTLLSFSFAALSISLTWAADPVAHGAGGLPCIGLRDTTAGQDYFLGIPFAQPPVGPLCFKPPLPWAPGGIAQVNATQYGASCEQIITITNNTISEDCLTLNIWKPISTIGKLPVMVYIYGGRFYIGDTVRYPGVFLVERASKIGKPIIYASIKYRIGIYGFPPGRAAYDAGGRNLGFKDQRLALEWVHKNIGYFGGDPNKANNFAQANKALYAVEPYYQANLQAPTIFGPTYAPEDEFITKPIHEILHSGEFAKVPFISGGQLDEGTIFVDGPATNISSEQDILNWLSARFPGLYFGISNATAATELLKFYPTSPTADSPYGTGSETFGRGAQYKRFASLFRDILFNAPRRDHLNSATKFGVKSWSYILKESSLDYPPEYGIAHAGDVPFVLQGLNIAHPDASPGAIALMKTIAYYWVNFAYSLDPNSGEAKVPHWPQYRKEKTTLQLLGSNVTTIKDTDRVQAIDFIIRRNGLF